MPVKGRGRVKKYRTKPIPGRPDKYLRCAVVSKKGKRGGTTVCHGKTRKKTAKKKTRR